MQNYSKIYSLENRFAWVEINLNNLSYNIELIKNYLGSLKTPSDSSDFLSPSIMAVVKANAYGHGLVEISKKAVKSGASWLGVALVQEGLQLRDGGVKAPILCLGSHAPEKIRDAVDNDITLSVTSIESARLISDLCRGINREANIHIKIDTGMNRIGINYKDAIQSIALIKKMPNIKINGVFTHFACASKEDDSYTILQWSRFNRALYKICFKTNI